MATDEYDDGTSIVTEDTAYVVDSNNHTGYAQVLEEWDVTASPDLARSYVIGHDVIAQADSPTTVYYLLADGHGSTRLLVDDLRVWKDGYNYDAYGNLIGHSGTPLTDILYSGEMTDATGLQYLRDRYYDPNTGRFNRLDPFAGNSSDPLSLHKYTYCHSSPIMGVDPSGEIFLLSTLAAIGPKTWAEIGRAYTTYNKYSTARKVMTAMGVGMVVAQAAASYVMGQTSISLAFSKCPWIRDFKNWPDIDFKFTYKNDLYGGSNSYLDNLFKPMAKVKVEVGKNRKTDAFDGKGSASIGVSGTFEYDFIAHDYSFSGGVDLGIRQKLYTNWPVTFWQKITMGSTIGTATGLEATAVKWDLGLSIGMIKNEKGDAILGANGSWTILDVSTDGVTVFGFDIN